MENITDKPQWTEIYGHKTALTLKLRQFIDHNSQSTVVYLYCKYYLGMHIVHVSFINNEHVTEINLLIRSYPHIVCGLHQHETPVITMNLL